MGSQNDDFTIRSYIKKWPYRPGSDLAISAHLLPRIVCWAMMILFFFF